jgi:RHS repeat-associated protein
VTGTDQRYYNSNAGRFYTPDPSGRKAVNLKNPTSWNMYAYTNDDPVNFNDPSGLDDDGSCFFDPCYQSEPGTDSWSGAGGLNCGSSWISDASLDGPCGDPCGGNSFAPAPDPSCGYAGPAPPPPPAAAAPPPPQCSAELEYTGVKSLGGTFNHAAVVVTDSSGYTITMEGFPQQTLPPSWGNLVPQNTAGNIGYTQWGTTLTSSKDPNLCQQVSDIETAEAYYADHEVAYYGWGPNSNSFANWLLESGYINQYFTQPPKTPGWNTPLYGTLMGIPGSS